MGQLASKVGSIYGSPDERPRLESPQGSVYGSTAGSSPRSGSGSNYGSSNGSSYGSGSDMESISSKGSGGEGKENDKPLIMVLGMFLHIPFAILLLES